MNAIQFCNISSTSDYSIVLDDLINGDFQTRWEAAKTLAKLGDCILDSLADLLATEEENGNEDTELIWFIARILGELNHPQAIELLIDLLQSEDEEIHTAAAQALSQANPTAIAALSNQLKVEETRLAVVQSLAAIDHPLAREALLTVVDDSQVAVRTATIAALSNIPDPRVPPILIKALRDLAAPVRREAVIGLGLLATRLRTHQLNPYPPENCTDACTYSLVELVALLQTCLWDFNLDVCHQAAIALGRTGHDQAAEMLFQTMTSPLTPTSLQLHCLRALAWMNTPQALSHLRQVFHNTSSIILWQEAILLLGRLESPIFCQIATQILLDLFQAQSPLLETPTLRQSLALSLRWLQTTVSNPAILTALQQLQQDSDRQVRLHAIAPSSQLEPYVTPNSASSAVNYPGLGKLGNEVRCQSGRVGRSGDGSPSQLAQEPIGYHFPLALDRDFSSSFQHIFSL